MNALTGAAIGIAAIGACYGIAWVVAKLTPSNDDAMQHEHGDWPAVWQMDVSEHGERN